MIDRSSTWDNPIEPMARYVVVLMLGTDAGGGHRGDALIECFGADAAGCAQLGEGSRLLAFRQGGSDALID